jgi:hypothetical protein
LLVILNLTKSFRTVIVVLRANTNSVRSQSISDHGNFPLEAGIEFSDVMY